MRQLLEYGALSGRQLMAQRFYLRGAFDALLAQSPFPLGGEGTLRWFTERGIRRQGKCGSDRQALGPLQFVEFVADVGDVVAFTP